MSAVPAGTPIEAGEEVIRTPVGASGLPPDTLAFSRHYIAWARGTGAAALPNVYPKPSKVFHSVLYYHPDKIFSCPDSPSNIP